MPSIILERVYEKTHPFNENSYLIDRLWPRGISKEHLQHVIWLKEVAPSNSLRKWYHEHLDQWMLFYQQYQQELHMNPAVTQLVYKLKNNEAITLLYGSKDLEHNHAIVLRDYLLKTLK